MLRCLLKNLITEVLLPALTFHLFHIVSHVVAISTCKKDAENILNDDEISADTVDTVEGTEQCPK